MISYEIDITGKHCTVCGYIRQPADAGKLKTCCPNCMRSYDEASNGASGHQALYMSAQANRHNRALQAQRDIARGVNGKTSAQTSISAITFGTLVRWMSTGLVITAIAIVIKLS